MTESVRPSATTPLPPIRREIQVTASVDSAFALFTAHIGSWWPMAELSVHGEDSLVAFEGARLVERSGSDTAVWAEVVEWNPPTELRLAWHPGGEPDAATDLTVRFVAHGETTLVSVTQSGWERMADPAGAAEEYGHGWPEVLTCFQHRVAAVADVTSGSTTSDADYSDAAVNSAPDASEALDDSDDEQQEQWFALLHQSGPALDDGQSVFEHPMFREHVAFLRRMLDRGLLVAAGPLMDEFGAGMSVLKVPSGQSDIDVVELATKDDLCVAGGYLSVTVRPWGVQFSA